MRTVLFLLIGLLLAGCGNATDEGESEQTESEVNDQLLELRSVDVQVEGLDVLLYAEINTLSDEIFYKVEQGEDVLQEESNVELTEDSEWESFEIELTLPEEVKDKADAPIVAIYGKGDNGDTINPNYIPVDIK